MTALDFFPRDNHFFKAQIIIFDIDFHSENFPIYSNLASVKLIVIQKRKKKKIEMAKVSWGTRISERAGVENNQPKLREQTALSVSKIWLPVNKIESIRHPGTL